MECFWLPGRPAPAAAPAASALSRLDSAASEVLPVSSQAPGFLGDSCTRDTRLPSMQAVWASWDSMHSAAMRSRVCVQCAPGSVTEIAHLCSRVHCRHDPCTLECHVITCPAPSGVSFQRPRTHPTTADREGRNVSFPQGQG